MIQRLRLFSGLVMLAYVTMHLLNHAVGLISLEAMENVLWYIFRIWTNRPAEAAALQQLPRSLRIGALRAVAATDIAAARFRAEPGGTGLRHPTPARPPRSHDAHLRQFSPHRCRLLRLSAVGLFRSLARIWPRADASLGRRLGSRYDRPAFLAEG